MNHKNSLISIVTVVYNDVINIEKTILSVINQTYRNIEYIIIDGGSTDGTIDIIQKYENSISHFISEPDNGIYDAMNKSLRYAKGTYIYFLNSGDIIFSNNTLETILRNLKEEDILFCDTILRIQKENYYLQHRKLTIKDSMPFCHQSVIVKTYLLINYNFDSKLRISADKKFFKHCLSLNIEYKNFNIPLGWINGDGFSTKNRILQTKENQTIFNESVIKYWLKLLKQYLTIIIIGVCPKLIYNKLRSFKYSNNKIAFIKYQKMINQAL